MTEFSVPLSELVGSARVDPDEQVESQDEPDTRAIEGQWDRDRRQLRAAGGPV